MDAELNHRLNYEMKILKSDREKYERRFELCRGLEMVNLHSSKHSNGKRYYFAKWPDMDKFVYLGKKDRPDVKRICEAHFLQEAIRRIDVNIKLLNTLQKKYLQCDPSSINAALRKSYQSETLPISVAYEAEGEKWKKSRLAFQAEYPENYPERKTEITSDGILVKTVSEVVLYERFKAAGLCQIYELPLVLKDYGPALYPDFSILSPIDMKSVILVEYVGRLDMQKYREDFAYRVGRYIANGYKPGVNLFFVFSDKDGHIDSQQINRVIADIRGI